MLFVGAIPRVVVEQALKVVDVTKAQGVRICCSGSFRLEQALTAVSPSVALHSNDVSLLSCALGGYATGAPVPFKFKGRLQFLEDATTGGSALDRLAALALATKLGHAAGNNPFARAQFAHHEKYVDSYLARARDRLSEYLGKLRLTSFFAGDLREHARAAIEAGEPMFAWPPTYKSGYESLYRLINQNTEWEEPRYELWDPESLAGWLDELKAAGARFVVCAAHALEGHEASAMFQPGRNRRIYLYTSFARSASLRRQEAARQPFKYDVVQPDLLNSDSRVQVVTVDSHRMVMGDLSGLRLLEKNARYMKAPVFNQLVANIKRDGVLTSVPTVYEGEVLSGNHRVQAALKAGVRRGFWLEVLGMLDDAGKDRLLERERQISIQLSHNSIVGEDDPNLLRELYEGLPLPERLYAGLTDDDVRTADPIDLASLSAGATAMETIELVFLPEDAVEFTRFVEALGKRTGLRAKVQVMAASLSDFNAMFESIIRVKGTLNVKNTALAMRLLVDLAQMQLDTLAEEAGTQASEGAS